MSSQCKGVSCEALSSACCCAADKAALALKRISSGSCPGMPRHAGRNCSSRWFVSPAVRTMRKCPANARSCGQVVFSISSWTIEFLERGSAPRCSCCLASFWPCPQSSPELSLAAAVAFGLPFFPQVVAEEDLQSFSVQGQNCIQR